MRLTGVHRLGLDRGARGMGEAWTGRNDGADNFKATLTHSVGELRSQLVSQIRGKLPFEGNLRHGKLQPSVCFTLRSQLVETHFAAF